MAGAMQGGPSIACLGSFYSDLLHSHQIFYGGKIVRFGSVNQRLCLLFAGHGDYCEREGGLVLAVCSVSFFSGIEEYKVNRVIVQRQWLGAPTRLPPLSIFPMLLFSISAKSPTSKFFGLIFGA
jgi:hypothetical protein